MGSSLIKMLNETKMQNRLRRSADKWEWHRSALVGWYGHDRLKAHCLRSTRICIFPDRVNNKMNVLPFQMLMPGQPITPFVSSYLKQCTHTICGPVSHQPYHYFTSRSRVFFSQPFNFWCYIQKPHPVMQEIWIWRLNGLNVILMAS